jgi:hypothetical protein
MGNHPSATDQMNEQKELEGKQYHRQAAIIIWSTTMRVNGSLRTATCESAAMTAKTTTTSSMIGGISG